MNVPHFALAALLLAKLAMSVRKDTFSKKDFVESQQTASLTKLAVLKHARFSVMNAVAVALKLQSPA